MRLAPLLARVSATEWVVLLGALLWSVVPLVYVALKAPPGAALTGADGIFAGDQLQYLAWIAEARDGGLIGNRFAVESPDVFVHPMWTASGAVAALGAGLPVAYLLWKPLAVLALVAGAAAWTRRFLPHDRGGRAVALLGALIMAVPLVVLDVGGQAEARIDGLSAEVFALGWLWGEPQTGLAVGLMPAFLLGIERIATATSPSRRLVAATAGAGLVASWAHPWQGEILLLTAAAVLLTGPWRRLRWALAVPLAATALPLLAYGALALLVDDWSLASEAETGGRTSVLVVAAALAPVGVLAALGARGATGVAERAAIAWIPATLLVHWVLAPENGVYHAFSGLSLPFAVLAVRGWRRLRLPAWALAALLALVALPTADLYADALRAGVATPLQPYWRTADERAVLDALRGERDRGPVLGGVRMGLLAPAFADRGVWAGHPSWTPDYAERAVLAQGLAEGRLPPAQARAVVRASGARDVVSACGAARKVERLLVPLGFRSQRIGCLALLRR